MSCPIIPKLVGEISSPNFFFFFFEKQYLAVLFIN